MPTDYLDDDITLHDLGLMSGQPICHPQIAVQDLRGGYSRILTPWRSHLYAFLLKTSHGLEYGYGQSSLTCVDGAVVIVAPGQFVYPLHPSDLAPSLLGLYFHPDLLRGTVLGNMIWRYKFIHYNYNVGLFLDKKSRTEYLRRLEGLRDYLRTAGEQANEVYLALVIKQMLDIVQEISRLHPQYYRPADCDVVTNFEYELRKYNVEHKGAKYGLPTVAYFADKVGLTPNYFGDLIKKSVGITPTSYIHHKMRETAMEMVLAPNRSVAEAARLMGFRDTAQFSKFFRKMVGCTPTQYIRTRSAKLARDREELALHPERFALL